MEYFVYVGAGVFVFGGVVMLILLWDMSRRLGEMRRQLESFSRQCGWGW